MSERFQVELTVGFGNPMERNELQDLGEALYEALCARAQLVAMGPAVSVDFIEPAVTMECTVMAEGTEALHDRIGRIAAIMEDVATARVSRSRTDRMAAEELVIA